MNDPKQPTMQELFGDSPFVTDPPPGGTGPYGAYRYNSKFFATPATAQTVAKILGGTVEAREEYSGGPFKQNQPNQMVRMPVLQADVDAVAEADGDTAFDELGRPVQLDSIGRATGRLINAGNIADLFNHGYAQVNVDKMISEEVGFEFHYKPAAPKEPTPAPVLGTELLVAPVGKVVMQADGTYWKRVATLKG